MQRGTVCCKKCGQPGRQLNRRTDNRPLYRCDTCDEFLAWADEVDRSPKVVLRQDVPAQQGAINYGQPFFGDQQAGGGAGPSGANRAPGAYPSPGTPQSGLKRGRDGDAGYASPSSAVRRLNMGSPAHQGPAPASWGRRSRLTPDVGAGASMHVLLGYAEYNGSWRVYCENSKRAYNQEYYDTVKGMGVSAAWDSTGHRWHCKPEYQQKMIEGFMDKGYSLYNNDGKVDLDPLAPPDKPGWTHVLQISRRVVPESSQGTHQDQQVRFCVQTFGWLPQYPDVTSGLAYGKIFHKDGATKFHSFDLVHEDDVRRAFVEAGFTLRCFDGTIREDAWAPAQAEPPPAQQAPAVPPLDTRRYEVIPLHEAKRRVSDAIPTHTWSRLFPHQREGVEWMVTRGGRVLLADDPGMGKTCQSLLVAATFYPDYWPLLIVCPPALKQNWAAEARSWLPDRCKPAPRDLCVIGSQTQLTQYREQNHGRPPTDRPHVCITTYDMVKKMEGMENTYRFVICDEAHALKTKDSDRTVFMKRLVTAAKGAVLISGTPINIRPIEIWSQADMVSPGLLGTWFEFGMRHCMSPWAKQQNNGQPTMLRNNVPDFNGADLIPELHERLAASIMLRRDKGQLAEPLPDKIRERLVVDVSSTVERELSLAMRELEATQERAKADPTNPVLKSQKDAALTQARIVTGRAKVDAVISLVQSLLEDNSDMKVIVFAHHKEVMTGCEATLTQQWNQAHGPAHASTRPLRTVRLDGGTNETQRAEAVSAFQGDLATRVMFASMRAAGQGLNLTAARACVFAELDWNPSVLEQAESRAHRLGQDSTVRVYYCVAQGSTDDMMWPAIQSRMQVVREALDGSDHPHPPNPSPSQHTSRPAPNPSSPNPSAPQQPSNRPVIDLTDDNYQLPNRSAPASQAARSTQAYRPSIDLTGDSDDDLPMNRIVKRETVSGPGPGPGPTASPVAGRAQGTQGPAASPVPAAAPVGTHTRGEPIGTTARGSVGTRVKCEASPVQAPLGPDDDHTHVPMQEDTRAEHGGQGSSQQLPSQLNNSASGLDGQQVGINGAGGSQHRGSQGVLAASQQAVAAPHGPIVQALPEPDGTTSVTLKGLSQDVLEQVLRLTQQHSSGAGSQAAAAAAAQPQPASSHAGGGSPRSPAGSQPLQATQAGPAGAAAAAAAAAGPPHEQLPLQLQMSQVQSPVQTGSLHRLMPSGSGLTSPTSSQGHAQIELLATLAQATRQLSETAAALAHMAAAAESGGTSSQAP